MNKTLAAIMALVSSDPSKADRANVDLNTYSRFRAKQKTMRRTRGDGRRSAYLLDKVTGLLDCGTRAKSRGPYPAHMIANCEKMRARKERSEVAVNGAKYRTAELRLRNIRINAGTINYKADA